MVPFGFMTRWDDTGSAAQLRATLYFECTPRGLGELHSEIAGFERLLQDEIGSVSAP